LLAVGDLVVTAEEKELGTLLIDLGGLTTGLAVYSEGSVRYTKELQIGSDFITRDISHSLKTSLATAQSIKEQYGVSMGSLLKTDSKFDFTGVDGKTVKSATRKQLVEIIQPRLDQIFVAIEQEMSSANLLDTIVPGGIVITGGGSMLSGIVAAAEQALGGSSRIGLPQNVKGGEKMESIISNPTFATAIGLVNSERSGQAWSQHKTMKSGPSLFSKFRNWAEELF
jgi:cell division protein FtsA